MDKEQELTNKYKNHYFVDESKNGMNLQIFFSSLYF